MVGVSEGVEVGAGVFFLATTGADPASGALVHPVSTRAATSSVASLLSVLQVPSDGDYGEPEGDGVDGPDDRHSHRVGVARNERGGSEANGNGCHTDCEPVPENLLHGVSDLASVWFGEPGYFL